MRRIHKLAACALLLAGRSAFGQENPDSLPVGAKVQIHGFTATTSGDHSYYYKGIIVGSDSAHLMVTGASGAGVDTLPYFAMSNVQVSFGTVSRRRLQVGAALTGAGLGVAAYLLVSLVASAADKPSEAPGIWRDFGKPIQISIPVLAVLGYVIGSLSDTEMWATVRIPHRVR
jgi:hypothetical protein